MQLPGALALKRTTIVPRKPKTILRAKSLAFVVIHDGKNLTPRPLNPEMYQWGRERQIGMFDDAEYSWKESSSQATDNTRRSTLRFKNDLNETMVTKGSVFVGGTLLI